MKMKAEHYAILKDAFVSVIQAELERLKGQPEMPQTLKQLIDWQWAQYPEPTVRRLHFDFFWWVRRQRYDDICPMMDAFYQYANDDHLFTALKAVLKEMQV
ncbi:hypothetical protein CHF33_00 [Pseudomonas phage CHF33]|uniref:Uncharacterized protein n=2 Tax=Ghunavirus TaxID=2732683 RepID=A0A7D0TNL1_9CAUD|nr:hypothetical protein CHF1_00 [Pseudomonas phage CHF1]QHB48060.1 hypothetical protein CHF33_00 [Pseudomonas phage CHF33]